MNGLDIAFLALLAVLVFLGVVKGLTRILIGVGALILAFALAARFHGDVAAGLEWLDIPYGPLRLLSYGLIFLGTMIAGGLVAYVMRKVLRVAMLSWADRLAGAAMGFVAASLISALLVLPLVAYSRAGSEALRGSTLAPYVSVIADLANRWVPRELSDSYQRKIEDLRRHWSERWSGSQTVQRRT